MMTSQSHAVQQDFSAGSRPQQTGKNMDEGESVSFSSGVHGNQAA